MQSGNDCIFLPSIKSLKNTLNSTFSTTFIPLKAYTFSMQREYIVFMDSGVGGLSTLSETYRKVSGNFLYFADNKNCPYGKKSTQKIKSILIKNTKRLTTQYSVKVVVLACNTATTSAIEHLRKHFKNIYFVGTEPAIRLAQKMGFLNIVCLLTPASARQKKYLRLVRAINPKIKTVACANLAPRVEKSLTKNSLYQGFLLAKSTYALKPAIEGADVVVLGCTHFTFVSALISKILHLQTIDGNKGVARQTLLVTMNLSVNRTQRQVTNMANSTKNIDFHMVKAFSRIVNLFRKKVLNTAIVYKNQQFLQKFFCGNAPASLQKVKSVTFKFSEKENLLKEKYIKIFTQTLAKHKKLC